MKSGKMSNLPKKPMTPKEMAEKHESMHGGKKGKK